MDGATVWWKFHNPNFNRFCMIHPCDRQMWMHFVNLGVHVHLRHFYLGSKVTGAVWPLLTAPYKNTYLLTDKRTDGRAIAYMRYSIYAVARNNCWFYSPIPCLRPPLGGDPLECGDKIWHHKTRITGLPNGEEIMMLRFDTIPARDRQTRCDCYYSR